jgi:RNA polymerase sigma-19 factor, ECF subfamily
MGQLIVPTADPAGNSALTALYSDHHGWLLGWLRRKLGSADQAADLAHDTFVRVIAKRDASSIREPRAYLGTIARRVMVDHFRREKLERAYLAALAALPASEEISAERTAIILEALCRIDKLLDGMSVKARKAFLLSQLDGLSYGEIAERLHVSVSSVKKYVAKAIAQCILCSS